MKIFSGQGVEKNNDMARSIVLRKSNKWDGAGDVLKLESRQLEIRNQERTKRTHKKQNTQYWEHEHGEERKKKRKIYLTATLLFESGKFIYIYSLFLLLYS